MISESATILIVEDEQDIRELLAYNLEKEGYATVQAADGKEGLDLARSRKPDLILLDLMLPKMDGLAVCRELERDSGTVRIPIIMLTARGEDVDRILGFELGADDYVVKPFNIRELLLRIRAILRRQVMVESNPVLTRHGVSVDPAAHKVTVLGQDVELTATEFRLIEDLLRNAGRVRTREELLAAVWGYQFEGYARTVDTASPSLLQRVAGLNATTAKNVVAYREENGPFTSRKQILKVPKLGPKAFEQCAGFLRVPESRSVLDNTAVHPESYAAAEKLLSLTGHTLTDVRDGKLGDLNAQIRTYGEDRAAADCGVGVPTLRDVAAELMKPGRDIRDELPKPILRTDVLEMKDLKPGMELTGTVRNVIDFGVFVDIGVHQDGLVHISQVSQKFIKHPSEVVSVGDIVQVVVLEVDEKKKRIGLSMKQVPKA